VAPLSWLAGRPSWGVYSPVIQEMTSGRGRALSTAKRNRFVLRVLLITAKRYLADLREINKSVTIILSLPTMLASFYGMNVGLPLHDSPRAFLMILGISFGVALVVLLVFWRRDWL